MSTKQTKKQKLEQETFKAIDHALSKILELSEIDDSTLEISDHLKTRPDLKEAHGTLNTAIDLATPRHETKRLCLGSALSRASDDVVIDLHQFINQTQKLCDFATKTADPKTNMRWISEHIKGECHKMLREVNGEITDRVAGYRFDIEDLKKNQEAA